MYLIEEQAAVMSKPKDLKSIKNNRLRMECVLQTVGDINRNKRRYSRSIMEEGLGKVKDKLERGNFYGELDHPVDGNPQRQMNVLFKEVSHRIVETGWDGNKLIAMVETMRSPNGELLKNFAEDGAPIGFSFRGMGELKRVQEGQEIIFDVCSPIMVVTWDAVTNPSHKNAQMIRVTEDVVDNIRESAMFFESENGLICSNEGVCYLPNDFDDLIHRYARERAVHFTKKYKG
ncbi:MAG: hypothetical protein ACOCQD_00535 [archaeon]